MATDDPRPNDDDDGGRQSSEHPTEQFPAIIDENDPYGFDDLPEASAASQAGVGFDRVDLIATREPSDLVRRYLFPTEKFRGEWRRHWIQLVKRMSIGVIATLILGYLAGFVASKQQPTVLTALVIIWLLIMGWVLWDVAEWYYDRFVLTN